jgi:hypothetical protein
VISREQLLELGFTRAGIKHRIAKRRLHVVGRGVYAVGRPELTQFGRWMAALLATGPEAVLSHTSAAALWGIPSNEETPSTSRSLPTFVAAVHAASPSIAARS